MAGGVNLNKDPRTIVPGQLALSKNAFPVIPGILGKRNGFRAFQVAMRSNGSRIAFINSWALAPASTGFLYVADVHMGASSAANRMRFLVATDFNNVAIPLSTETFVNLNGLQTDYEPTKFVNYRGQIIAIVPGIEGYYTLLQKPDSTWVWVKNSFKFNPASVTVQHSQNIPVTPYTGCQYKQRMVYGNFGPGRGNWIIFADRATATIMSPLEGYALSGLVGTDVLSLNSRHIEVGAIDGEDINVMQEITLGAVGSAVESVLMLLTNRTCMLISGEILQTIDTGATDPNGLYGTYKEHRVNYEAGCVATDTLVKTPYGWIWAGPDDVWILRGNYPERIGTNIRPALLACPAAHRKHWSAAYADGKYVLQLVTQSTVTSDFYTNITTYLHEYWYLDMEDGAPESAQSAQWYGPMVNALDTNVNVVYSKLLSTKDRDGTERILVPGQIIDTAPLAHRNVVLYDVLGNASKDDLLSGTVTASEWQPSTAYRPGDIIRPRTNSITRLDKSGYLHVCIANHRTLDFYAQGANFTVGQLLTGASSRATGTIVSQVDNGATGTLVLEGVVGEFIANEVIDDTAGGAALATAPSSAGLTGSSEPDWAVTSGGFTTDGNVRWLEIRGAPVTSGVRLETGRAIGEFQADIRTRDDLLDDNTHEKLVRRLDVNIAAQGKVNIAASVLMDQGATSKALGAATFGAEDLHLGFGTLSAGVGGLKSVAKALRPTETQLIQCRQAQFKIQDSNGYVIDDSNDYLLLAAMLDDGGSLIVANRILQVKLTQGVYADMDALLTHIVAKLNELYGDFFSVWGATVGATPFSFSSAYAGVHPYMTRIQITYTSLAGIAAIGFNFGSNDVVDASTTLFVGDFYGTAYTARCKKLLSMLGYDTDAGMTADGGAYAIAGAISPTPTDEGIVMFAVSSSPLNLDGIQVVHKYNSTRFDISSATAIIQPKGAAPLQNRGRS
jgi:hypothetical protein